MSSHRKAERVKISEYLPGGCSKNKQENYTVDILIPSLPPTDLTTSSVCRVKYEIQIVAEVNCCHNSPELIIPITIGSIPFIENYHRLKRRPTAPSLQHRSKSITVTNYMAESKLIPALI